MTGAIVASHTTSWHDGGVAVFTADGQLIAISAERVGDRYKHSWNSRLSYDFLRSRLGHDQFGGPMDRFRDVAGGLETDSHHLYHAASAYYASGLQKAAVLVVDGQGPAGDHLSTTTIWCGSGSQLVLVEDVNPAAYPFADGSIGHFYTAIGALAGFRTLFCEGKTMALAAYGGPSEFLEAIRDRVNISSDGTYAIDPLFTRAVLSHTLGPLLYSWPGPNEAESEVWRYFQSLRKTPDGAWPTHDDMNIAYAGQVTLEQLMVGLARRARDLTGCTALCLAGGVMLNCVANERIRREVGFDTIYVVPAPADDGQALGKLYLTAAEAGIRVEPLTSAYLGPDYTPGEYQSAAEAHQSEIASEEHTSVESLAMHVAELIAQRSVVGWCDGRSELGPRALGHRSILADARDPRMRDRLNTLKGREWFRPVAPIVLAEDASQYFDLVAPAPYMTYAVPVITDLMASIPSAVHVDGTARVQTLDAHVNPKLHLVLQNLKRLTGYGLALNTSFNGKDEPIVETPEDAIRCFVRLGLDYLVLGNLVIRRREA